MKNTVRKDGGNSIVQHGTVKSQEGGGMRACLVDNRWDDMR